MNLSTTQRNSRRSILGSHGYSFQFSTEPTPLTSKSTVPTGTTINMNITNVTQRRPRKSMLGTHRVSRESLLPILPELLDAYEETKVQKPSVPPPSEPSLDSGEKEKKAEVSVLSLPDTTLNLDSGGTNDSVLPVTELKHEPCPSAVKIHSVSPLRKRLDSMFSPGSNDDSFVANETLMANDESVLATTLMSDKNDESVLATTLTDKNTTLSNSTASIDANEKTTVANQTVISLSESDEDVLRNFLKLMETMIEKNTQSVIRYTEQVEELQKKINDSNKEIEDIKSMKRVLAEKFKLKTRISDKENTAPTNSVPSELASNPRTPTKFVSPASPSKQVIKEMRSTLKFLKTPRLSRAPRSSVLLTPHSMSFCIKSQYEQLLE